MLLAQIPDIFGQNFWSYLKMFAVIAFLFQLINPKKQAKKKSYKNSGRVRLPYVGYYTVNIWIDKSLFFSPFLHVTVSQ